MVKETQVTKWFHQQMMEWERKQGKRQTIKEFANWLEVTPSVLGNWMKGNRVPNYESAKILAKKLSPEIFSILGFIDAENPDLLFVNNHWDRLSQETKLKIINEITNDLDSQSINVNKTGDQKV